MSRREGRKVHKGQKQVLAIILIEYSFACHNYVSYLSSTVFSFTQLVLTNVSILSAGGDVDDEEDDEEDDVVPEDYAEDDDEDGEGAEEEDEEDDDA